MPLLHWKTALATTLCAAAFSQPGLAQVTPTTILEIDTENVVNYFADTLDVSKFATNSGLTTTPAPREFEQFVSFQDIVAVNGQPARGTLTITGYSVNLRTAPTPGQAIADTIRTAQNQYSFEILNNEGVPIGSLFGTGLAGGGAAPLGAPPGAPLQVMATNAAIVGGTGPFLAARGQFGAGGNTTRQASITEDPISRRINGGGGKGHYVLHVIPVERPEVVTSTTGPAIYHADFSAVTAAKPAKAGEVLIVKATGLGPTVPGVDPGQPFPDAPPLVNSPIAVTMNGKAAEVLNSIGWPGLVDTYRVDFRVPSDAAAGTATVQMTAAWIAGPAVSISIQ